MAAVLRQTQPLGTELRQLDEGLASALLGAMQNPRDLLAMWYDRRTAQTATRTVNRSFLPFTGKIVCFDRRRGTQGAIPDAYAGIRPMIAWAVFDRMGDPKAVPHQHLNEGIRCSGFRVKLDDSDLRQWPVALQEDAGNVAVGADAKPWNHLEIGITEVVCINKGCVSHVLNRASTARCGVR
jgi:hypothetical protein